MPASCHCNTNTSVMGKEAEVRSSPDIPLHPNENGAAGAALVTSPKATSTQLQNVVMENCILNCDSSRSLRFTFVCGLELNPIKSYKKVVTFAQLLDKVVGKRLSDSESLCKRFHIHDGKLRAVYTLCTPRHIAANSWLFLKQPQPGRDVAFSTVEEPEYYNVPMSDTDNVVSAGSGCCYINPAVHVRPSNAIGCYGPKHTRAFNRRGG